MLSYPCLCVCIGAAVGPLLAGLLSAHGWDQVFYMLMTADFFALLVSTAQVGAVTRVLLSLFNLYYRVRLQLLLRLVFKEMRSVKDRPRTSVEWVHVPEAHFSVSQSKSSALISVWSFCFPDWRNTEHFTLLSGWKTFCPQRFPNQDHSLNLSSEADLQFDLILSTVLCAIPAV